MGYTVANDLSARDLGQRKGLPDNSNFRTDWVSHKCFDGSCPMGPWIVTKDEIADPHALDISLEIGGETLQKSNTRELVFQIPRLVEYVSSAVTLEPGDVFATGTPGGVGFARKPPRWLKAGEEVIVRIEGIGELRILGSALAALSKQSRMLAWIAPPYLPYAPALAALGIDLKHILIVRTHSPRETLWATEQALRSQACGLIRHIAWHARTRHLKMYSSA